MPVQKFMAIQPIIGDSGYGTGSGIFHSGLSESDRRTYTVAH